MQKYFNKGAPEGFTLEFPVTADNFPPSEGSKLASPRIGKRHPDIKDPIYPEDEGFREEFEDALKCQSDVKKGIWPTWFLVKYGSKTGGAPTKFLKTMVADNPMGKWEPKKAALIVKMDDPDDLGRYFYKYHKNIGDPLVFREEFEHIPFVEGHVRFLKELISDCYDSLEVAFENKYYFGVARPAEALTLGQDFCLYPHPTHPSAGAGHGSVAGQTFETLDRWFILTEEQRTELLETCFQFAMYRTFSFQHYPQDNLIGLGMSSQTMRSEYEHVGNKYN